METLYITRDSHLRRDEHTLRVDFEDGTFRRFPIEGVAHIVCLGSSTLTTKLLELCGQVGVRLSIFNHHGVYRGTFEPKERNPAGEVVMRQAMAIGDARKRLDLARAFVLGSGWNALNLLKKIHYSGSAHQPAELASRIQTLDGLVARCEQATDVDGLMGHEGVWRMAYYQTWGAVATDLAMGERVRRPPDTPINAMVSFFNQLLYASMGHQISKTHLSPLLSFLHSPARARQSLALDLAEVFRPVLVDRLIFRLVRQRQVRPHWFSQQEGVCLFSESGLRDALDAWRRLLEEEVTECSWATWMHREALALERHLLGLTPAYRPYLMKS